MASNDTSSGDGETGLILDEEAIKTLVDASVTRLTQIVGKPTSEFKGMADVVGAQVAACAFVLKHFTGGSEMPPWLGGMQ